MNKDGKKLDQYCHISSGGTPSRRQAAFYGGDILWSTIADMERSDGVVVDTKEKITPEGLASIGNRIFAKNTLLLAMYGSVGKVAIAGKEMATNQAILGITPKNEDEIYIPYLKYWLMVNKRMIVNKARGGILKNLSAKIVKNLKIDLPLYDEQIKIANLLTQVETLIAKREKSIELLDELLKSTFLDMFGDPVLNTMEWEKVPLSQLGEINRGISKHRPRNAPELLGGKYPLIQTGDVSNADLYVEEFTQTYSDIGLAQSKLWKKDTLCITIAANIAKTAILKFDACFPDSIVGMEIDEEETNLFYVHFLFKFFQKLLEKNAPQAAQKNINLQILRSLKVPKPEKDLQDKFATIVQQVENTKEKYQDSLDELNELFGSLSQRAFWGELELGDTVWLLNSIEKEETVF